MGFRQTLDTGISILEKHLSKLEKGKDLSGEVAFQLHDTYGFPIELTQEITNERGIEVDLEGFSAFMAGTTRQRASGPQSKRRCTDIKRQFPEDL